MLMSLVVVDCRLVSAPWGGLVPEFEEVVCRRGGTKHAGSAETGQLYLSSREARDRHGERVEVEGEGEQQLSLTDGGLVLLLS